MNDQCEAIARMTMEQEQTLRCSHFSNEDAWNLGCCLVKRIREQGIALAVCIRRLNGHVLFQYAGEGTSQNNENWMRRKFNTVALLERCSFGVWAEMEPFGRTPAFLGQNPADHAFIGGGFPIRLKTGEMTAVLTVSGLEPEEDHRFLVEGWKAYLEKTGDC